ncbi:MAG: hypothetical protein K2Y05_04395 [Hyphomicrobiaceae bacterium]|nr:hypothetical protein [Hyphomicrobiaceae bacterium]
MNKLMIGGIAAVAVVAAAAGGWFYVQNRAKGEVEAAFAELRSAGMTASYQSVAFDPFGRSLTVSGISIADKTGATGTIAKATAEGIDLGSKDFSARAVTVNGADYKAAKAAAKASAAAMILKFDQAAATAVRIGKPAAAAVGDGDLGKVAAAIQALDIGTISVPKLEMVTDATAKTPVTATYSAVTANRFRDGRIGAIEIGGIAIKMTGEAPFDLTSGPIKLTETDLIATLGVRNPNSVVRDGRTIVQGPFSVEQIKIATAKGQNVSMERLAGAEYWHGAKFVASNYRSMMDAFPRDGRPLSPKDMSALMEKMAALYEDVGFDSFEVKGIKFTDPTPKTGNAPAEGRLALMRIGNLNAGIVEEYALEGLSVTSGPAPFELGRVALKGLAVSELYRTIAKMAVTNGKPPSADQLLAMAGLLKGIDLRGLDITEPRSKAKTSVHDLKLSWGKITNGIPAEVRMNGVVDFPLDPTKPDHAALMQRGFKAIPTVFDVGATWSEADKSVRLDPGSIELKGLGAVRADLRLGNVPREAIGIDQARFMAALPEFELQALSLDVTDQGAIQSSEAERAAIAMQLAATRAKLEAAGASAPGYVALMASVEQFMAAPGKTLSIRLAPKARLTVADLLVASQSEATFASLLDSADFQSSVK